MIRIEGRRLLSSLANSGFGPRRVRPPAIAALAGKGALLPNGPSRQGGKRPAVAPRRVIPSTAARATAPAPFSTGTASAQDPCHHDRDDHDPREAGGGVDAPPLVEPGDLYGPRSDGWWTGRRPSEEGEVPGRREDGRISSLPQLVLRDCTKQSLQAYFDNSWMLTESLFAGLQGEEAFLLRPAHGLRHPLVFYYGHAAALYVNKLRAAGILQAPVNAYFEALLETGVDEMAWDDIGNDNMEWPSLQEVHAYRQQVYRVVSSVIQAALEEKISNITADSPYWALPMAMEHERIHVETSSVLIRELPLEHISRPATWPAPHVPDSDDGDRSQTLPPIENPLVRVEGGVVRLGKPKDFPSFGWDNEYGSREFSVPGFEAAKHMVTNGEFLDFVADAGYARQELWSDVGWRWKMFRNVKKPHFWVSEGPSGLHRYRLRHLFDEVPLPRDSPVLVNFHEAKAFAKWKTFKEEESLGEDGRAYRLTTELEQKLLRGGNAERSSSDIPELIDPVLSDPGDRHRRGGGGDGLGHAGANANLTVGSETPVDAFPPNEMGFCDTRGNAWEWCEDHFSALEGFAISPLYEDFSTPCFDGEHHVIAGGSFASTGNEASVFARYHFRPHFHQHAGFRLVAPERKDDATRFVTSCTDAPSPFVGSYPFRTADKGASASSSSSGWAKREAQAARSFAANVAMHFAVPEIAREDATVAEGLHYPQRCARIVLRALDGVLPAGEAHVVEVGCGAGGASFELSKGVGKVVALEANKSLVDTASKMARESRLTVPYPSGGARSVAREVSLDGEANPERITFKQCDPMCLPAGLAGLDAALIHSTIDAIPSPNGLLGRMGGARGIVREDGGIVVVVSAYEWNEDVTPEGAWLGGYVDKDGNEVPSIHGLSRGLGEDFKLVHMERVPCMRPLTDRTFEYVSAEATVWRRD